MCAGFLLWGFCFFFPFLFVYISFVSKSGSHGSFSQAYVNNISDITKLLRSSFPSTGIPLLLIFNVYIRSFPFDKPYSVFFLKCHKAVQDRELKGTLVNGCYISVKRTQRNIRTHSLRPKIVQQCIYYLHLRTNTLIIPMQQIYQEYFDRLKMTATYSYEQFHHQMLDLSEKNKLGGSIEKEKTQDNPYDDLFHIKLDDFFCISCNKKASLYELPFKCKKCSRYICNICYIAFSQSEPFDCPYCEAPSSKIYQYIIGTADRFWKPNRQSAQDKKLKLFFGPPLNSTIITQIISQFEKEFQTIKMPLSTIHSKYQRFTKCEVDFTVFYLGIISLQYQSMFTGVIDIQGTPNDLTDDILILKSPDKAQESEFEYKDLPLILKKIDIGKIHQSYLKLQLETNDSKILLKRIHTELSQLPESEFDFSFFYNSIDLFLSANLLNGQIDKGNTKNIHQHKLILIFADSFICQLCSKSFDQDSSLLQCGTCLNYICQECSAMQQEVGLHQCPVCDTELKNR